MATKNWNAGIIRPVPVAPTGPYQDGAAPGVWTLDQVAYWQKQGLWPIAGSGATPIGLFGGGYASGASVNTIDRVVIGTSGNATDFGDLTRARAELASCSSATRGVWAAGYWTAGTATQNIIDYVTIATAGNATDFGDTSSAVSGLAGCSSSTRGLFAGGSTNTSDANGINVIEYITIASVGNTTDFGDLTAARQNLGALSSTTRGVFAGGNNTSGTTVNTIDYVTIASTGNAVSFGQLITGASSKYVAGCASSTRGVFGGGNSINVIQYITIASTGNATDFGDLTNDASGKMACSSSTIGLFAGGAGDRNVIDYITIASTGNAADFGDLTQGRLNGAGCSNVHGGL